MRRIFLSFALLIPILLIAGCLATVPQGPEPVMLQSVEATPTAEAEATAETEVEAADWPVFADGDSDLVFPYPPAWTIITGTAMIDRITAVQPEATGEERDASWLALAESPAEDNANFTVAVLPAERLPLQLYLDSVTSGLSAVEGVVVNESELRGGLRPGGVALPSIRYDLPDGVTGWQVAFFDDSGAQLFVFTFTAPESHFEALQPLFSYITSAAQVDIDMLKDDTVLAENCPLPLWYTRTLHGVDLSIHLSSDWGMTDLTNPPVLDRYVDAFRMSGMDEQSLEIIRRSSQDGLTVATGVYVDERPIPNFSTGFTLFRWPIADRSVGEALDLLTLFPSDRIEIGKKEVLENLRVDTVVEMHQAKAPGVLYSPKLTDIVLHEYKFGFLNASQDQVVLLHFLTAEERAEELLPLFKQIVACLSLNEQD